MSVTLTCPFTREDRPSSPVKDRQICLSQFKPVLNFFYQLELEFLIQVLIVADIDFSAGIVQFELAQFQHISLVVVQNRLNCAFIAVLCVQNGTRRYGVSWRAYGLSCFSSRSLISFNALVLAACIVLRTTWNRSPIC